MGKIKNIHYISEFKFLKALQKLIPIKNQKGHYKIPKQIRIKRRFFKWLHEIFAHYFCNIINVMEVELKTIKLMHIITMIASFIFNPPFFLIF